MRLAACALSAVLLSGCSWLGLGGQSDGHGASYGAYGDNCAPAQSYGQYGQQYGQAAAYGGAAGCAGGAYGVAQGYGAQGYGQGYEAGLNGAGAYGQAGYGQAGYGQNGAAAGYGAGQAAYGAAGYGQAGFGPAGAGVNGANSFGQAGFGQAGFGQTGFGPGAVGAGLAAQGIGGQFGATNFGGGNVTTLGAAAPFGAAAFGGNVVGSQLTNGQFVNGAAVQNVVGAPIYVPQPYAAPYGVPQLRGVGAALPWGFEVFGGTEVDVDGSLFGGKEAGPSSGGGGFAGAIAPYDYSDAFGDATKIGAAVTYDLNRNTTLIASADYSNRKGQSVSTGSFQSGVYDPVADTFTPDIGSTERALTGEFSDLEEYTFEGGVRQYFGGNTGIRPYVGATAGVSYNDDVQLQQTFDDNGDVFDNQEFIDSGWNPTASGLIGAELAVGPRAAIGVEGGIRWRDNLNANTDAGDRISVPLKLRGRLAF